MNPKNDEEQVYWSFEKETSISISKNAAKKNSTPAFITLIFLEEKNHVIAGNAPWESYATQQSNNQKHVNTKNN